jgi:glutamine amidotransferase
LGQLNCLLSDGERLFCYHDQAAYKGLTFRKIYMQDGEKRRFADDEVKLDLVDDDVNHGFVIATNPLTSRGWLRFQPGELIVLEGGSMRYSSHRSPADALVLSLQKG